MLVHYLNVPYPDDAKLLVVASVSLWAERKEWSKDELISQLRPMCKYLYPIITWPVCYSISEGGQQSYSHHIILIFLFFIVFCLFVRSAVLSQDEPNLNNELEVSVCNHSPLIFYSIYLP